MKVVTRRLPAGMLAAVVALGLLSGMRAAPGASADETRIVLETKWLVLRKEDVNPGLAQMPDEISQDERGLVHVRKYEPDYRGKEDAGALPLLIFNKLWQANDANTARQIFDEQAGAGFPESQGPVACIGGMGLPGLGEQAAGIQGRAPCDSTQVHTRIVFRHLNVVNVLYVYGDVAYADTNVVMNLANILSERARAVPTSASLPSGPAADVIWNGFPRQLALSEQELGKEIGGAGDREGSDGGAQWVEVRFKRGKETEPRHFGPLDIYNKVWVAPDLEKAGQIFAQQAKPGFPEAHEPQSDGQFPMENLPGFGNENFGWTGCAGRKDGVDCDSKDFRYLHQRYVFRAGNVVVVIYSWGGDQDNTIEQISQMAQKVIGRLR